MASTEDDWFNMIREIVSQRHLVPGLAADAKEYVLAERTIEKNAHLWEEAINDA
jgi:hypothetical protein